MRWAYRALAAAILVWRLWISSPAVAQYFLSGNQLYDYCTISNSKVKSIFLDGFIIGVLEKAYHDRAAVLDFTPSKPDTDSAASGEFLATVLGGIGVFCVPAKPNPKQLVDVFCKYLRDNPGDRHLGGSTLVVRSMEAGFPQPETCGRK
jgi:hypothetical protein